MDAASCPWPLCKGLALLNQVGNGKYDVVLLPPLWAVHASGILSVLVAEIVVTAIHLHRQNATLLPICTMAEQGLDSRIPFVVLISFSGLGLLIYDMALARAIESPSECRPGAPKLVAIAVCVRVFGVVTSIVGVVVLATVGVLHANLVYAWTFGRIVVAFLIILGLSISCIKQTHSGYVEAPEKVEGAGKENRLLSLALGFLAAAWLSAVALGLWTLRLIWQGLHQQLNAAEELAVLPLYWAWLVLLMPAAGATMCQIYLPSCMVSF